MPAKMAITPANTNEMGKNPFKKTISSEGQYQTPATPNNKITSPTNKLITFFTSQKKLTCAGDRLRDILESTDKNGKTVADRIVEAIRDAAIGGDVRFVELILDRIEGKVPNVLQVDDISNGNDEDVDAIYGKAGLSFPSESDGGPSGPGSEPCSSADPASAPPSPGESCGP
jgi:hypothetical protein